MGRTLLGTSACMALLIVIGSTAAASSRHPASKKLLPPPPPMGHRLMLALDADVDGQLSSEEVVASAVALLALDDDGDGKLSHEELSPPPLPGGPLEPQGPHYFFGQHQPPPRGPMHLDIDGDGAISVEEFLSPARDAFSRFDSNSDGFIDKEEATLMPPPPHGRHPRA